MALNYHIYALCCPIGKRVMYVGFTTNIKARFRSHLRNTLPSTSAWIKRLKRCGAEPILRILEKTTKSDFGAAETRWINYYRSKGPLLNRYAGGARGAVGYKHSSETRIRLSVVHKGKKFTSKHKKKLAISALAAWKGPGAKRRRKLVRAALLGNKARRGRPHTKETKAKMAQARRKFWAIKTEAQRAEIGRNMSKGRKG